MSDIPESYWPCMCVARDDQGNLSAIKCHSPAKRKCRECGATRPSDWLRICRDAEIAKLKEADRA